MLRGIEEITDQFVRAAERVKKAGYDGVEVMGSEGYFINQFLVTHTNHRSDEWGGSYENRMRLPVEIVQRVREAVGPDFIIIYRLSMLDLIPDGSSWDEAVAAENLQFGSADESQQFKQQAAGLVQAYLQHVGDQELRGFDGAALLATLAAEWGPLPAMRNWTSGRRSAAASRTSSPFSRASRPANRAPPMGCW